MLPYPVILLVGVSALLFAGAEQVGRAALNMGNIAALAVVYGDGDRAEVAVQRLLWAATSGATGAYWTLSVLTQRSDNEGLRHIYQEQVIRTTPDRIGLLAQIAADDAELAEQAIALRPERAEGFAWRAFQLAESDPAAAVSLFSRALELEPKQYEWWLGLGKAYEVLGQFPEALAAYDRACTLAVGILPCREKQQLQQKMRGS